MKTNIAFSALGCIAIVAVIALSSCDSQGTKENPAAGGVTTDSPAMTTASAMAEAGARPAGYPSLDMVNMATKGPTCNDCDSEPCWSLIVDAHKLTLPQFQAYMQTPAGASFKVPDNTIIAKVTGADCAGNIIVDETGKFDLAAITHAKIMTVDRAYEVGLFQALLAHGATNFRFYPVIKNGDTDVIFSIAKKPNSDLAFVHYNLSTLPPSGRGGTTKAVDR